MKKEILSLMLFIFIVTSSNFAQESYYNTEHKSQMKTLELMLGEWEGSGWMFNRTSRQKETFTQKEVISYQLDSTALLIHGKGYANGQIIHDALAIITADTANTYSMSSFLGDGKRGVYQLNQKEDGSWEWRIQTEKGTIVYTIILTETTWNEVGVFDMNGNLFPFFEMNLKKKQ
tara:strand:- start:1531 stop:2055 length:525 start_codon:yes stop_codon:yes gene_type:complete